jgi:hypothetical protein
VAETQPVLFCTEKQQTDKKIMAGTEHKVPKATSHHGNPVYFDPHDNELAVVQHYRKQHLQEERRKREAREFQRLLKTIPKVDYFPTTRLAEMYAKSGVLDTLACGNSSSTIIGAELSGGDGGYEQVSPGATAQVAGHDGGGSRSLGAGGGSTYSSILQVPVRVRVFVWRVLFGSPLYMCAWQNSMRMPDWFALTCWIHRINRLVYIALCRAT